MPRRSRLVELLDRWHEFMGTRTGMQIVSSHLGGKTFKRTLKRAADIWSAHARDAAAHRGIVAKALANYRRVHEADGWVRLFHWYSMVRTAGELLGRSRRAGRRTLFSQWKVAHAAREARLAHGRRSLRHWRGGARLHAMSTWRSAAQWALLKRHASRHGQTVGATWLLRQWRALALERGIAREGRQLAVRAIGRRRKRRTWAMLTSARSASVKAARLRVLMGAHAVSATRPPSPLAVFRTASKSTRCPPPPSQDHPSSHPRLPCF